MTLGALQGRVWAYLQENRQLPRALDEVLANDQRAVDAWDRPIAYRQSEDLYELRSAGEDGQLYSEDDVYMTAHASRIRPCVLVVAGRTYDYSDGAVVCASVLHGWPRSPRS
jgi:hypothetical protein